MPEPNGEKIAHAARVAATAAGMLLSTAYRLEVAVADPEHRGLPDALRSILPACQALSSSFPAVRTRVAGLAYQSVEYAGYEGSSALHVVVQIAELIGEIGERLSEAQELSSAALEMLAKAVDGVLPGSLDDWLRTKLDTEFAALERELGTPITDELNQMKRPTFLSRVQRMVQPYMRRDGRVVPSATTAEQRASEVPLDPTDEFILKLLAKDPNRRLVSPEIARKLVRDKRSIGKNLSKLHKAGLIHNERRKGYRITDAGVARASKLLPDV